MIMKISAASASAAFVCLAAKLIQTLGETQLTIVEVKNSVNSLTKESQRLIQSAEQVTVDIQSKIKLLEPLLESAQDVGEVVHSVTDKVKQNASIQNKVILPGEALNTSDQQEVASWQAPVEDIPSTADIYKPDNTAHGNTISSSPDGVLKIRIK
ncbi:DUF948 domain-containing protein [Jeotgalibacillus sp. S-D1]|uniref:DUF948 domain-containing protein n=1 Tax=Jeotgalibacillus sp. S-D1 TaxID=2552189 RepID=UPI001059CDF3|nr:DUF948 domain-containing protein [Jeotgalibacillus sp. S-D1]TDL31505.1 DUF948 domain-containing protein [Jeotgalibacillus sp. S-D1]